MMSRKVWFGILVSLSLLVMVLFTKPWTADWATSYGIRSYIMGLAGLLGMIVMTRQALLGIRPMFAWWSRDFFRVNRWHKRLGIGTVMAVIIHPIATIISYGTSWLYAFVPDFSSSFETWVTLGKIAFDLIIAVLLTSILSRKIMRFRVWRWVHLLTYPAFILVWLHAYQSWFMIATNGLVAGYWIVIGVVLLTAFVVRLAYQFGWLKLRSTVISHIKQTSDVYELTLQLPRAVEYTAGQFVYVQYPRGGESHPFTVLSYDQQSQLMRVAYKTSGRWTQSVATLAGTSGQDFWIDGPYGRFTADIVTSDRPVVCIAAGIGITPFYELVQQVCSSQKYQTFVSQSHEWGYCV